MESKTNHTEIQKVYLAFGCFWGKEYLMQNLQGVLHTKVGYMGGHVIDPSYIEVCSKRTGHAETVEVVFDSRKISFEKILEIFFTNHNPNSEERQKENTGNYRSAIFYTTQEQKKKAEHFVTQLKSQGYKVLTQIAEATSFYKADDRHQNYCHRTGNIPKEKKYLISELLKT